MRKRKGNKGGRPPGTAQGRETARERYYRAQAERAELENARRRGELVPAGTLDRERFAISRTARDGFQHLTAFLAGIDPDVSRSTLLALEREIRRVLSNLAGVPFEDPLPAAPSAPSHAECQRADAIARSLGPGLHATSALLERAKAADVSPWALARELLRLGFVPRGDAWWLTDRERPWTDPIVSDALRTAIRKLDQAHALQDLEAGREPAKGIHP